jgi:hypothetical protein
MFIFIAFAASWILRLYILLEEKDNKYRHNSSVETLLADETD